MKNINIKKLVLLNLPYALIGLYATKLGQAWRLAEGVNASEKLLHIMDGFAGRLSIGPCPAFTPRTCWWALPAAPPSGWRCISRARTPRNSAMGRNTAVPDGAQRRTSGRISTLFSRTM